MTRRWNVSAPVTVHPKGDVTMTRKIDGVEQRYATAEAHPSYDDGLRAAARRAWESRHETTSDKGFYPPCFSVYFDGVAIYVRDSKAAPPKDAKLVCIAQFFSGGTVQLRFDGARSEWIEFDK